MQMFVKEKFEILENMNEKFEMLDNRMENMNEKFEMLDNRMNKVEDSIMKIGKGETNVKIGKDLKLEDDFRDEELACDRIEELRVKQEAMEDFIENVDDKKGRDLGK